MEVLITKKHLGIICIHTSALFTAHRYIHIDSQWTTTAVLTNIEDKKGIKAIEYIYKQLCIRAETISQLIHLSIEQREEEINCNAFNNR